MTKILEAIEELKEEQEKKVEKPKAQQTTLKSEGNRSLNSFLGIKEEAEKKIAGKYRMMLSASSVNTFKQCNRKFWYGYIEKLPRVANIHQIRGNIVHSALESFFEIDITKIGPTTYDMELGIILRDMFNKHWQEKKEELEKLDMGQQMLQFYYKESLQMIDTWFANFLRKLNVEMEQGDLITSFKKLTPLTELYYRSEELGLHGYVDAIHQNEDGVVLMDYKTSKKSEISDEYYLQLAIYAMLYEEKHGVIPTKAGVDFLKHGEVFMDVDEDLIKMAREETQAVHKAILSNEKGDYPKNITPLCKWRTGQCDFYDTCKKED